MEARFRAITTSGGEVTIDKARLTGDGWTIEIRVDDKGIVIRTSGSVVGADSLLVIPDCSNVVRVTNDALRAGAVHTEAQRLVEIDKSNREFWESKGQKKSPIS